MTPDNANGRADGRRGRRADLHAVPATIASEDDWTQFPSIAETLRAELDRSSVPSTALLAAREIHGSSRGRLATPVRKSFVRRDDGQPPPMALVYRGGRSGVVALKLYLALLWRCAAEPYETAKLGRAWAMLLGLDDPSGKGARRVADALRALEAANLVRITRRPGTPHLVTLLNESGNGEEYSPPGADYAKAPKGAKGDEIRARNRYLQVPSQLWLDGDIQQLKGPGLVVLLILLAERAGDEEVWFSTEAFPSRYGRLSPTTRAAGTRQLRDLHLLEVTGSLMPPSATGSVFAPIRRRNTYRLIGPAGALTPPQPEPEVPAPAPTSSVTKI